jgi:hypothetical protein
MESREIQDSKETRETKGKKETLVFRGSLDPKDPLLLQTKSCK